MGTIGRSCKSLQCEADLVSASKEFYPRGRECPEGTDMLFVWVTDFMEEAENSNTVYSMPSSDPVSVLDSGVDKEDRTAVLPDVEDGTDI